MPGPTGCQSAPPGCRQQAPPAAWPPARRGGRRPHPQTAY
jgi:hypothetical protein